MSRQWRLSSPVAGPLARHAVAADVGDLAVEDGELAVGALVELADVDQADAGGSGAACTPAFFISRRSRGRIFKPPSESTITRTSSPSRARAAKALASSAQMSPVHQT